MAFSGQLGSAAPGSFQPGAIALVAPSHPYTGGGMAGSSTTPTQIPRRRSRPIIRQQPRRQPPPEPPRRAPTDTPPPTVRRAWREHIAIRITARGRIIGDADEDVLMALIAVLDDPC